MKKTTILFSKKMYLYQSVSLLFCIFDLNNSKFIYGCLFAFILSFSYAQSDTTLVYHSFRDSVVKYRAYPSNSIEDVSPIHYPRMQKAIVEREVTTWLNYDQEAYLKFELEIYDHEPSDLTMPSKVLVGPNGAKAWNDDGELVAEESMDSDYYVPLYENVVQSMLNDSPDRGSSLPNVTSNKIDEFQAEGFTYQSDDGMHIFSSSDMVLKYDPSNQNYEALYYEEGEGLTRSRTQYFAENPDDKYYAALEVDRRYGTDSDGLCYTDNKVRTRSNYIKYVSPYLESLQGSEESVVLYPNPASNHFSIEFVSGTSNFQTVKLINAQSTETLESWSGNYNESSEFSVSSISPGIYIVEITRDESGTDTTYHINLQVQ